jgi:glycine/D-amino acid oxidase-like deaminating enzyme
MQVIVVGGGIFGLAQAWAAAKRGHRVQVIERSQNACGASIRNFGMIWPIGQMPGEPLEVALESRELWLQVARESGIWVNPCGSLHVAYREDEWAVIEEFADRSSQFGYRCELLTPESIQARTPVV